MDGGERSREGWMGHDLFYFTSSLHPPQNVVDPLMGGWVGGGVRRRSGSGT